MDIIYESSNFKWLLLQKHCNFCGHGMSIAKRIIEKEAKKNVHNTVVN